MRKKSIFVSAAIIVVIGVITLAKLSENITPEPISEKEALEKVITVTEGVEEGEAYDYEISTPPPPILDTGIEVERIPTDYLPLAEAAVREYITQSTNETGEQRVNRLKTVFHDTSSHIYDAPPAVDKSRSKDTTSTPEILYNKWDLLSSSVFVTVYTKVTTLDNETSQKVSEIYQVYDVTLTEKDGKFKAQTINFSDEPVVIRE